MSAQRSSQKSNRGRREGGAAVRGEIRVELREVIGSLRQIRSVIAVAVSTLRQQNADLDADVASLLQRSAGDTLEDQAVRLEAVLRRLPERTGRRH